MGSPLESREYIEIVLTRLPESHRVLVTTLKAQDDSHDISQECFMVILAIGAKGPPEEPVGKSIVLSVSGQGFCSLCSPLLIHLLRCCLTC